MWVTGVRFHCTALHRCPLLICLPAWAVWVLHQHHLMRYVALRTASASHSQSLGARGICRSSGVARGRTHGQVLRLLWLIRHYTQGSTARSCYFLSVPNVNFPTVLRFFFDISARGAPAWKRTTKFMAPGINTNGIFLHTWRNSVPEQFWFLLPLHR